MPTSTRPQEDVRVNSIELAQMFSMHPTSVSNWRSQGKGPKYDYQRGKVSYRVSDIRQWIDETGGSRGRYLRSDVDAFLASR